MRNSLGVLIFVVALFLSSLLAVFFAGPLAAAGAKRKAPASCAPIKNFVYLVLMPQSPPLHLIETPNMKKCEAAARHTANAKCVATKAAGVKALKSKIGGVSHLRPLPARIQQRK